MAYPSSFSSHPAAQGSGPHGGSASAPAGLTMATIRSSHQGGAPFPRSAARLDGETPGDHQLEKLEFALAVALTRGDQQRSSLLREQIAALGGNREEPGT